MGISLLVVVNLASNYQRIIELMVFCTLSERKFNLGSGKLFSLIQSRLDAVHVVPGDAKNKLVEAIVESNLVTYGVVSIYDEDQSMKKKCLKLGIPFHTLGFSEKRLVLQYFSLFAYVSRMRPKSLYLHSFYPSVLGAGLSFFCPFTKIVSVRHHNMVHLLSKNRKGVFLDRFVAMFSFRTIAVSSAVKATMVAEGCNAKKISVIHNGIELSVSKYEREPFKARDSKIRLLAIGRLDWQKNYETMLCVAAELKNRGFQFTLTIMGTGSESYADTLFELSKSLGIENQVVWLGWNSNVEKWLAESDIFLHTAIDEACPLALIEALLAGIPVVTSRAGGSAEVIDGFALGSEANDISEYISQIELISRNIHESRLKSINQIPLIEEKFGITRMRTAYENYALDLLK
jgi:glycosyltransferase involved in cell wall biosynthesis